MASRADAIPMTGTAEYSIWRVILASAVGTMIEWYDFYIFGSLAAILSPKFYPPGNDTFAYIAYLATFAVGFLVRPFGALFFGRIGDLVGRKYAFLVTLSIMGGATAVIGLLPTYKTAGWFAPITLLLIRVLQGLALGGEYGGATVYVAEHVPDGKRGFYTSFIQITATLGLFVSLVVILTTQNYLTKEAFADWGWRIPFLISIILVTISLYIRLKMRESPIFAQIKTAGMTSVQPLKDAFGKWENLKRVLISLFGATAGQGVIWYTGQFYALFYLQSVLKVNPKTSNIIVAIALLCAMPFFTVFGALSDKVGRRNIMTLGFALAVVSYWPVFTWLGTFKDNPYVLTILVFYLVILVTMVYGPIAAFLVELFPAKIRYTSMSLPYHIGNGVFGGLVPAAGASIAALTGIALGGLFYPMGIAALGVIVSLAGIKNQTQHIRIWDEVGGGAPPLVADQP